MTCPTSKIRHETKEHAKAAIRGMKSKGCTLMYGLDWYKCHHCGFYHVGNRKKKPAWKK